ncbi:hypothetical protein [Bacteroides sp.]|uniref:hypothetical protein n=1 Tax=Bacteroides sp. TaxID=29523 RepID=UPI00260519D9|nr:hypothetical protein [Bacteroides sp.]MDD3037399.1 hypothetical protein [Bacteroides sp.]
MLIIKCIRNVDDEHIENKCWGYDDVERSSKQPINIVLRWLGGSELCDMVACRTLVSHSIHFGRYRVKRM